MSPSLACRCGSATARAGQPAPVRERLWEALIWSQPAAYAGSAIGGLLFKLPPLPLFWGTSPRC